MIFSTYGIHQKSFYKCGISIDTVVDAATVNTGGYVVVVEPVLLRQQEIIWMKNLIGGVFDSQQLGYKSSLLAVKVPPEDLESVAEYINQFPGVTHNYQRSHTYNLWFTLSASGPEKFSQIVEIIKIKTGICDILELPAINIFQHEVKFNL